MLYWGPVCNAGELALRELLAHLRALHEVAEEVDIHAASERRTHEGGVIPLMEEQVGMGWRQAGARHTILCGWTFLCNVCGMVQEAWGTASVSSGIEVLHL
jgi:hypothetical protein